MTVSISIPKTFMEFVLDDESKYGFLLKLKSQYKEHTKSASICFATKDPFMTGGIFEPALEFDSNWYLEFTDDDEAMTFRLAYL